MGPKSIPVRPPLTQEVNDISTSQEAPTLRPTPERHAPRGRDNATTTKSLSPELPATKKFQQPKPRAYGNDETTIMNKETPDREQIIIEEIATLANSTYHTSMTTSPYVPLGSLGHSHEAQKTKHASSRNQIDLFHISTVQEQDNMSKPVTTQRLPSHGSTSNEDRDGDSDTPEVSATPKNTKTTISTPTSGPDPMHMTMREVQEILTKIARDITGDLTKQNQQESEEQTDTVTNLQITRTHQTLTGTAPVQITMAQLQAMMATTARDLTHDLSQQQQIEEKLQQVAMHKLQQRHQQARS